MVQVNLPDKEVIKKQDVNVIGIDRGIKNIAVLSNNTFFNSKPQKSEREISIFEEKIAALRHSFRSS